MGSYSEKDILRIAKRFNNNKRTYLLVNPLQGKHIPVQPSLALEMMRELGNKVVKLYPTVKLVIGFSETATAVGAAVAESFSPNCIYVHTTREAVSGVYEWVLSSEEHSHATEQKLVADDMAMWINNTGTIVIVDDEISTGTTILKLIENMKARFPQLHEKVIVAASLVCRMTEANEQRMTESGIKCVSLVKVKNTDYSLAVDGIDIREAEVSSPVALDMSYQALLCDNFQNARRGINICTYKHSCVNVAETFMAQLAFKLAPKSSVLVLGTEECMYPALILGDALENCGQALTVRCHATTRSPIGVSTVPDYPITSGKKLRSFYDLSRITYIYDLKSYDTIIVVSDTEQNGFDALGDVIGALPDGVMLQLFYIKGGNNVWYTNLSK